MSINERRRGKDIDGVENWTAERPAESEMGRLMRLRERGGGSLKVVQDLLGYPARETRSTGESHTFLSGDAARDLMMSVVEEGVLAQYGISAKNPELNIKGNSAEFVASVAYKNSPAVRVALEMESREGKLVTKRFGGKGLGQDALLNLSLSAARAATGVDVRAEIDTVLRDPQKIIRDAIAPVFEVDGAELGEVGVEITEQSGLQGFRLKFRGKVAEKPAQRPIEKGGERNELVTERGEMWAGKVRDWVVGQYGPRGYQFISPGEQEDKSYNNPLTEAMLGLYGYMGLGGVSSPDEIKVLAVPIEKSGNQLKLGDKYSKGSEMVVFSYKGRDTDSSHRNGVFSSVFVMNQGDAETFVGEVNKDPRILFELTTAVRGKPPTRHDGLPMEIFISGPPVIMANSKYGGRQENNVPTQRGFPEGYRPFFEKNTQRQKTATDEQPSVPQQREEPAPVARSVQAGEGQRPSDLRPTQPKERSDRTKSTEDMSVVEIRQELLSDVLLVPGREAALKNQLRLKTREPIQTLDRLCVDTGGKNLRESVRERVLEVIKSGKNPAPLDVRRAALLREDPKGAELYQMLVMDEVAFYRMMEDKSGQLNPNRGKLERVRIPILENEDRKNIKGEVTMNRVVQNPGILFYREGRLKFSEVVGEEAEILDRIVESTDEEVRFGAAAKFWRTVTAEPETSPAWGSKANEIVSRLREWLTTPDFTSAGVKEKVERLERELGKHLSGGTPQLRRGYALAVVSLETGGPNLDQNIIRPARECLLFDF